MKRIAAVSLCNTYSYRQSWFPLCVGTWRKNLLPGIDKYFVSDGTLNLDQQREIETLSGGYFFDTDKFRQIVSESLLKYPSISRQRELCVFYRRIIDFSFYFEEYDHILSLDTDIGVVSPVQLDSAALPDFAFCIDDVPGYSASPAVAFAHKMITGLNAGFMLFKPKLIVENLDFIEDVTHRYISKGRVPWWSEQACWALIGANLCSDVKVFSPKSVAIVSGLEKRTLADIHANKTRYFKRSKEIKELKSIREIIGDAKVIHFAGPGKPWIQPIMGSLGCEPKSEMMCTPDTIALEELPPFPLQERFMLSLRLLKQYV